MSTLTVASVGKTGILNIKKSNAEQLKYRPDLGDVDLDISSELNTNTTGQFSTITGGLMESCVITLEPVQSGSGDPSPSNVRPITGHSSVDNRVIDKDLLTHTATTQTLNGLTFTVSGTKITVNGTATAQTYIEIGSTGDLPQGDYWYSGLPSDASNNTYFITRSASSNNTASDKIWNTSGVQVPRLYVRNGITCNNVVFDIAISKAYEKTTTPLGQTVYGGSVDVVSGVGDTDEVLIDLGDLTWNGKDSSDRFYAEINDIKPNATGDYTTGLIMCSAMGIDASVISSASSASDFTIAKFTDSGLKRIYVKCSSISSSSDFKTAVTGIKLLYQKATASSITFTPSNLETLIGQNTVTVPLDGQSLDSLTYREVLAWDDVQTAIEPKADKTIIGTEENGATASKSYTVGEHFIKNGKFCTAIASISSGATLTLNTNYVEGTIADAFKSLDEYVISDSSGNAVIQAQTNSWMIVFAPNGLYTLVVTTAYQWNTLTRLFESGSSASYDTSTGKLTISGVGNNRHVLVKRNPL